MNRRQFIAGAACIGPFLQLSSATQGAFPAHLLEAREHIVRQGRLGQVNLVEICCYGGAAAEDGARLLEMARWMLHLEQPERVDSTGSFGGGATVPVTSEVQISTWHYPNLRVVLQLRRASASPDPRYPCGVTFHGDRATLRASHSRYDLAPAHGEPVQRFA